MRNLILATVIAQEIRTGREIRIGGRWFADCTGDACVGALAGADFDMQATDHMGPCNLWNVCECKDTNAINTDTTQGAAPVPFPRCLYSRNIANLFMAGRDISVEHGALGAVRVMRTCGCEGEVIGMAAIPLPFHPVIGRYATNFLG